MSFTVYDRILLFEKSNPTFTFNQKGSATIGLMARKEWAHQGGNLSQLDTVQRVERWGTFMVLEYPQSFSEDIDKIIKNYVKVVIAKGIRKKAISEKPSPSKQQKQNSSVPSSSKRKRKRIPIVKPAFSGNRFKK